MKVGRPIPRAVVHSDDTITVKPEGPGQRLDDHGPLFDETQEQSKARREYDMHDMSWQPFTWSLPGNRPPTS